MESADSERLSRNAMIIMRSSCRVVPGENVVLLTRRYNSHYPKAMSLRVYADALAEATVELGAMPVIMDVEHFLKSPEYASGSVIEPLKLALAAADVVINTTCDISLSSLLSRDDNDDEFLRHGPRRLALQSHGMDMWDLDENEVAATPERTKRLMELLAGSQKGRVTTPGGTDFSFDLAGSSHTPVLGIIPLYGEVAIAPAKGAGDGVIVTDGPTQGGVRPRTELDREPLVIEVASGVVTGFSGDDVQVQRLEKFIKTANPPAVNIDEIGIPTTRLKENDVYWWSDGTHHTDTIHIALGNNLNRSSHVHGAAHMDCEVIKPTLELDGRVVLSDNVFYMD